MERRKVKKELKKRGLRITGDFSGMTKKDLKEMKSYICPGLKIGNKFFKFEKALHTLSINYKTEEENKVWSFLRKILGISKCLEFKIKNKEGDFNWLMD